MDPLLKTAILRTLGFLLLTSLSAWLFVLVEYTEIDERKEKYHSLYSLYQFLASKYNMSLEEFNNISNIAYEALSEPKPQWTYGRAAIFVLHALTTIGYGWITPQTPAGQMLCILVSLLGIPITLLAFKSIGELIAKWVNTIVTKFEKKVLKRLEPKHMKTKGAVILFSTMISLIALNSVWLMDQTDWTLVEGVYFWFTTFTTIGFGDYVVGHSQQRITMLSLNNSVYQESHESLNEEKTALGIFRDLFLTFYIIFTLCIVSSVLNAIMAVIEERRCRPRCPGCVPRKTQETGDNDVHYSDAPNERGTNPTCLSMENFGISDEQHGITLST